jgi:hypothetical protein
MLTWLVATVIGFVVFAPQTPLGAALRRLLVERPAVFLNRLRRTHWILAFAIVAVAVVAAALGRELFFVFAQGTPELIAWIAAFDIAAYVDVIAAAVVVAAAVRLKAALTAGRLLGARLGQAGRSLAGRRRSRRPRRRFGPPAGSGDGEPWPAGLAVA